VLGIALGLGLLAKYAMIYFVLGVALAALLDADARRLLRGADLWIALAVAAVIVSPNLIWNWENGLATFRHTGANIEGRGLEFDLLNGLAFVGSQFGVFGPVVFAVLLYALIRIASPALRREDRLMLAFAVPPLLLVTATAFLTRALANWAATAFVSGVIVVAAILVRERAWKWIALSLGLGIAMQAALLVTDAIAPRVHLPWLKNGDVYHRTLGWRALGEEAGRLARQAGARAIVSGQRESVASLLYYWRDRPERILAWPSGRVPTHQFEITRAFAGKAGEPVLFVSQCPAPGRLSDYFATVEPAGRIEAPMGPTSTRVYHAFRLAEQKRPIGPLGPCR
jgi:4-amino-4-deoxy-L-arabinose transferase-like glycosyltransferase